MNKRYDTISNMRTETCNLTPNETHLGSICVAIVSGSIGGLVALNVLSLGTSLFPFGPYGHIGIHVLFGFYFSLYVCKKLFETDHNWYGHNSIVHRIYYAGGIISGVSVLLIYRYIT